MARVFVQPNADGTYSTVYEDGGNFEEIFRGTQQMAEQNANVVMQTRLGQPTVRPSSPALPPANYSIPGWDAAQRGQMGTNQQQFDEQKRQAERGLYSQLVQGLLSGAAALRGPGDWLKYNDYMTGGKGLFKSLYGNTPVPQFGAPSGQSAPATLEDILRQFGIIGGTGGGNTGGGDTSVEQMRQALYNASGKMDYWLTAPVDRVIAEYQKLTGKTATSAATAPAAAVPATATAGAAPNKLGAAMNAAVSPVTTPTAMAGAEAAKPPASNLNWKAKVPLPYQMNPMVWDSLSPSAKQMVLASVEKGDTPSGAWDAEDWLAQLNSSRPKGIAPRSVSYGFAAPQAYF